MARAYPYGRSVVGRRLRIVFRIRRGKGHKLQWFSGKITRFDKKRRLKHFVEYDNGDKQWHDLLKDVKGGSLRWMQTRRPTSVTATGASSAFECPSTSSNAQRKRRVIHLDESDQENEDDDDVFDETMHATPRRKRLRRGPGPSGSSSSGGGSSSSTPRL